MENNEVMDSGIVGFSESEEFLNAVEEANKQVEELKSRLADISQEKEDLEDDLGFVYSEMEDMESKMQSLLTTHDPDTVKSNVIDDMVMRLNRDGLMTAELEEWIENYCRFYINNV